MDRCLHTYGNQQCQNQPVRGFDLCEEHIRRDFLRDYNRHMYHLKQAQQERLTRLQDGDGASSLRIEAAMIRSLIETLYNSINSDLDLLAQSTKLSQLALTLERLLKTCHQIEKDTGALLRKDVVITLSRELYQIVAEELKAVPGFENISERIVERFSPVVDEIANQQLIEQHD